MREGRAVESRGSMSGYEEFRGGRVPIRAWVRGVPVEKEALQQLRNVAQLPIVHSHIAAMPDVHFGIGATVGSVIPTVAAIIPAAVGVDIGCGMMAVRTSLRAEQLPDDLRALRSEIERAVPHGRTDGGGKGDRGAWSDVPAANADVWRKLRQDYEAIVERHPSLDRGKTAEHLGTLGGGNHFLELCLDEEGRVWVMLHSGSRGVGNRIGQHFIQLAKKDMGTLVRNLPDLDLAYVREGTERFDEYVFAVLHFVVQLLQRGANTVAGGLLVLKVANVAQRHLHNLRHLGGGGFVYSRAWQRWCRRVGIAAQTNNECVAVHSLWQVSHAQG